MLVYQRVTTMVLLHVFIPTPGMGAFVHHIGVHPDIRIQETVLFAAFLWLGLARWGGRSPQKVMKPYLGVPKMRCLPENLGYWNYWNYGNWKYSEKHASNSNYHNLDFFFGKNRMNPVFFGSWRSLSFLGPGPSDASPGSQKRRLGQLPSWQMGYDGVTNWGGRLLAHMYCTCIGFQSFFRTLDMAIKMYSTCRWHGSSRTYPKSANSHVICKVKENRKMHKSCVICKVPRKKITRHRTSAIVWALKDAKHVMSTNSHTVLMAFGLLQRSMRRKNKLQIADVFSWKSQDSCQNWSNIPMSSVNKNGKCMPHV